MSYIGEVLGGSGSLWLCFLAYEFIFKWYFFPFLLLALRLRAYSWRRGLLVLSLGGSILFPWIVKQKLVYDTFASTTYEGRHLAGMLWLAPPQGDSEEWSAVRTREIYPPEAEIGRAHV